MALLYISAHVNPWRPRSRSELEEEVPVGGVCVGMSHVNCPQKDTAVEYADVYNQTLSSASLAPKNLKNQVDCR